jgi:HEPN domain-containing protein
LSERDRRQSVAKWLRYASEDLRAAEASVDGEFATPRHACWLAQQSAEKAIKALLIYLQIDFPKTHDLDWLRALAPDDTCVRTEPLQLTALRQWAVEARYPGDWPDPTLEEAQRAISTARGVLDAVNLDLTAYGWFDYSPNEADCSENHPGQCEDRTEIEHQREDEDT